ncbi:MAG: hypothetical protein WA210_18185 [Burkholderiaceae bacterium]
MNIKEIAWHACKDCSVNVIACGEYCLVNPDIWERKLGLGWGDNLCIGCIERRLGRELGMRDFAGWPNNPAGYSLSDRYRQRLGFLRLCVTCNKPFPGVRNNGKAVDRRKVTCSLQCEKIRKAAARSRPRNRS